MSGQESYTWPSNVADKQSTTPEVKQMALRLFQQWAVAFRDKRDLSFLVDVYNELKNSGTPFPAAPTQTSSHLFSTITAPEWVDSDVCMRCRTAFTFTNRKHHCRNCGLVFDQACSSKTMELPHFGITTPVRVCDSCYVKGGKPIPKVPAGPPPAVPGRTPRSRADFDADLQRAIELSLADSRGAGMVGSEPPMVKAGRNVEDDDEELRLAIEASLREMEARPSAPNGYDEPEYKVSSHSSRLMVMIGRPVGACVEAVLHLPSTGRRRCRLDVSDLKRSPPNSEISRYRRKAAHTDAQPLPTFDLNPRETETILTFSNTLDQMAAYGERDLRRFPHAHVLYEQAYGIGGKLHRNVEEKTTKQRTSIALHSSIVTDCSDRQTMSAQWLEADQQKCWQRCKTSSLKQWPCMVKSWMVNRHIPRSDCKSNSSDNTMPSLSQIRIRNSISHHSKLRLMDTNLHTSSRIRMAMHLRRTPTPLLRRRHQPRRVCTLRCLQPGRLPQLHRRTPLPNSSMRRLHRHTLLRYLSSMRLPRHTHRHLNNILSSRICPRLSITSCSE